MEYSLRFSASEMKSQAAEERKACARELEVATITYFGIFLGNLEFFLPKKQKNTRFLDPS